MKITAKGIIKYLIMLALALVLLFFVFRNIEWDSFVDGLKQCNYWWIFATMLLNWGITIMRGFRWRLMMLPLSPDIKHWESYDAYSICYLANMGVPRSGEVVRCGLMSSRRKISFEGAIGSVVLERTWDLICVFILFLAMIFLSPFGDWLVDNMLKPMMDSMGGSFVFLCIGIVAILVGIVLICRWQRERIAATKVGAKVISLWRGLVNGVKAGFKMDHKFAFFTYTILIWVGYLFTSLFTIYAFPAFADVMTIGDALFLMIVGSLGWIVPVPGGFGAYHFIVAMTLVPIYHVSEQMGLVFATISHESQIVQMLIWGVISLITFYISGRKLKNAASARK